MNFLLDGLKDVAGRVGSAAAKGSVKAKLKADLLFIDREILARQHAFGVEVCVYPCCLEFLRLGRVLIFVCANRCCLLALVSLVVRLCCPTRQKPSLLLVR